MGDAVTGGEALVRALCGHAVTQVFGIPGTDLPALLAPFGEVEPIGQSFPIYKIGAIDVGLPRRESKSGRGHKGYGSRAGAKDRARFEGGQNPIHMRMRKLRGPTMKKSMPFEKFRTHTQPVNLSDLEARFDGGAEVTPDSLREAGLATRRAIPVKVLGSGELTKGLIVHAHGFSKTAREKIEAAGGTCQLIEG